MKSAIYVFGILLLCGVLKAGQQRPASQARPKTVNPQTFPPEVILAGQNRFSAECGFCHGRDAAGGEIGPDLTRSTLIAEDSRGDKLGPMLRAGRVDKGMPAFDLDPKVVESIYAYIHDQKRKFDLEGGGRRSVDVSDLQTGNAEAGRRYFEGAGGCTKCHSATGDLAGVATRFRGLPLLQKMLYPASVRPVAAQTKLTVTLPSGEVITGPLASRDEFRIALTDASGARRTWLVNEVKYTIDDPMAGHFEQLSKYSDDDMHNVFAYLQTLK
jgi:cytochrome c oxidase cbb3-type subunit 3